ncbi:MAG TPA: hypothetical protein VNY29_12825 [Terriglobales bacterium]|jgi:hypothetical protein|nr:hypothetical protein [Terriglobales bacterium]
MARFNSYPFWTHDTVAAAVLAGVGAASFQIKLDALASELKIPAITACAHAWPMFLIFAGVLMLLVQPVAGADGAQRREDDEVGHQRRSRG